jgi:outer membrane protein TolC
MRGRTLSSILAVSAFCAAAIGCASAQLDLSQRETGDVLTDIQGRVDRERAEAKKASDAKAVPKAEEHEDVPPVLTLKDALRIAGRENRDLLTSREGLTLSALALLGAQNDVGPRLAGSLSTILHGDDRSQEVRTDAGLLSVTSLLATGATASVTGTATESHGLGDPGGTSGGGTVVAAISQPLLRGGGYEASHEALTSAQQQALYDVRAFELTREDLALEVQRQFYELVTQKQVIHNRELSLESFKFLKARSDRLFELGRVSEVDKFRAAREYLVAENDLVDARQAYEALVDRFKLQLGVEATTRIDVVEEIPEPRPIEIELRHAIDVALTNRLDLMTAKDGVADAERRVRIAERNILPDVKLEAASTHASPAGSRHVDGDLSHESYSVGLAVELPLDLVHERAALRTARIELDRARRNLSRVEDDVILGVRQSMRSLRSAVASLKIQVEIAASEEKNVKVARMRFEQGEISNRDLTDAMTNLVDARDRLVREQAIVETARTQLLRDLGVLYLDAEGTWKE